MKLILLICLSFSLIAIGLYLDLKEVYYLGLTIGLCVSAMVFTIEKIHKITTGNYPSDKRLNAIINLLFKRRV